MFRQPPYSYSFLRCSQTTFLTFMKGLLIVMPLSHKTGNNSNYSIIFYFVDYSIFLLAGIQSQWILTHKKCHLVVVLLFSLSKDTYKLKTMLIGYLFNKVIDRLLPTSRSPHAVSALSSFRHTQKHSSFIQSSSTKEMRKK